MGITNSASIHGIIDKRFKSIRKYTDQFYGQITVLEDKKSCQTFALVEKTILSQDKYTLELISNRKNNYSFLVKIIEYYECSTDFCSGMQKYLFLLEYHPHTLFDQICFRGQKKNPFTSEQLFSIFSNYIEIVQYMLSHCKINQIIISNRNILFYSTRRLKSLQALFKCTQQTQQFDSQCLSLKKKDQKKLYLSPQSFKQVCRKQMFRAKQLCCEQKNIVFMIGINFLQIILFADMSQLYMFNKKQIDFNMLEGIVNRVTAQYGQELSWLIYQMTLQDKNARPQLQIVRDYAKTKDKRRKISFPLKQISQGMFFNNQYKY